MDPLPLLSTYHLFTVGQRFAVIFELLILIYIGWLLIPENKKPWRRK